MSDDIIIQCRISFNREKVQATLIRGEEGMKALEKDVWRAVILWPERIVAAVIEKMEKDKNPKENTEDVKTDDTSAH